MALTLITTAGAISQRLPERSELEAKISNSISERMANLYVSTSHITAFTTHQEWRSADHLLKPSAPCWGTAGFSLRSSSVIANCWSDIFTCFHLLSFFFFFLGGGGNTIYTMTMYGWSFKRHNWVHIEIHLWSIFLASLTFGALQYLYSNIKEYLFTAIPKLTNVKKMMHLN